MRLWWNQSLASCGWWLVGDPSVRPSVCPSVYIRPYVRETCFRVGPRRFASVDDLHRSWSRPRRDDHDRRVITRERVATRILPPKIVHLDRFQRERVCCECDYPLDLSELNDFWERSLGEQLCDCSECKNWEYKDWTHLSIWLNIFGNYKYVEYVPCVKHEQCAFYQVIRLNFVKLNIDNF